MEIVQETLCMEGNKKAMVLASFVADSLALGMHWIYNTARIEHTFGRIDSLLTPGAESYHSSKARGDFTHYGDQALVLLESVASRRDYGLHDFSLRWRNLFKDYTGYVDQVTSITLSRLASGNPGFHLVNRTYCYFSHEKERCTRYLPS